MADGFLARSVEKLVRMVEKLLVMLVFPAMLLVNHRSSGISWKNSRTHVRADLVRAQ